MDIIQLHFHGPLTFTPGQRSLFHSPLAPSACVYLWTIQCELDGLYYIHYVGETTALGARHREHLVHVLGLNYGTFDVRAARRGVQTLLWPGLWRDKSPDAPGRLLAGYVANATAALEYLAAVEVFAAQAMTDTRVRKHIEGSIAWSLRNNHEDKKALYPDDNRVDVGKRLGLRLQITADADIAGLDDSLDI